ncbi:hypothetical protein [Archangium sp.]|uniref:hypothetical protein n=1 Tax=Archangium sp. TaxID=1872627 RepID=UPI00286C4540|nr:hypothetical protein [Archangium sp.]
MSISALSPRINLPSLSSTPSVSRSEPRSEVRAPEQRGVESLFARDCFQPGGCARPGPDLTGGLDKALPKQQLTQMLGQLLEQLGFKREDIDKAFKALGLEQGKSDASSCGSPASDAGKAGGCGGASQPKAPMSIEELIEMLMQNPRLLKNPQLLQQLMKGLGSAQQGSKSASPVGELSGLSRFMSPQSLQLAA